MNKEKILTAFCFTDIHNQQAMLDMPTTLRKSFVTAAKDAYDEFGAADICINGGDNFSDYPYWNRSCAWPKKNFEAIRAKLHKASADVTKDGKVMYVSGNNDFILGDIGTAENAPYNTTDFYDLMDGAFGALPDWEKLVLKSKEKPTEKHLGAYHYVVNGVDFIGINLHPDTAFNSHDGYYSDDTMLWVKKKLCEIDPDGHKPVFCVGHLSTVCYRDFDVLDKSSYFGDTGLFMSAFKGHKNAFYLYGHIHGEHYVHRDASSGAVTHIDSNGSPLGPNLNEDSSKGKTYEYSFVHMGGLRPFGDMYFENDGLTGYGGNPEPEYYPYTATPKLAQYLVFEVYEDRAVFHIRNSGSMENFSRKDKLKPYTVYFE